MCPGASACRAARHGARRRLLRLAQACHRLIHLRCASGCFGTSRGLSRDSSSTTSPRAGSSSTTLPTSRVRVPQHVARLVTRLVVDYFASGARPGASARHASRRRLLRLRRASGCLGTSRGISRGSSRCSSSTTSPHAGSSSTTSPTLRVRVTRHVAQLVSPLAVDYFAYVTRPGASARRAARHTARRQLLRAPQLRLAATRALLQPCRASRLLVSRQHWLYINYTTRRRDVVFWSHRVDHSS
jgi:hypothetical protein